MCSVVGAEGDGCDEHEAGAGAGPEGTATSPGRADGPVLPRPSAASQSGGGGRQWRRRGLSPTLVQVAHFQRVHQLLRLAVALRLRSVTHTHTHTRLTALRPRLPR